MRGQTHKFDYFHAINRTRLNKNDLSLLYYFSLNIFLITAIMMVYSSLQNTFSKDCDKDMVKSVQQTS